MRKFYFSFLLFFVITSFAQNEFYNNGGLVYLGNRVNTTIPNLKVNGNIINNDGILNNDGGLIEIAGNWTNTSSSYYYQSTGIERFSGTSAQTISGTWNGTVSTPYKNQFYDLKINKASSTGEIISLAADVNINVDGSLVFESTNGIIRTDASSHGGDGSLYPYRLFLQNEDPAKFSNYSTGSGATTKYIEGKLKRQVGNPNTYYFPIGVASGSLDGMESFQAVLNYNPSDPTMSSQYSTGLTAYIHPASGGLNLITNGDVVFYDIGAFSIAGQNHFSECTGGPDGHDDVAVITQAITHEWVITPDVANAFNYNVTLYPGPNLDNLTYSTMGSPCNSLYTVAKYVARNGRIGGNQAVGPTSNYWVPGVQGLYMYPTGNTIPYQTAFTGVIRLYAASDVNTSLPVELTDIRAVAMANTYINVSWNTASEKNNKGFVLLRSTDGSAWDSIGWIQGHFTTSTPHSYSYDDRNTEKGVRYYYRLKQIDYTSAYTLSKIVSAELIPLNVESVIIYPNPSNTSTFVQILSPLEENFKIDAYNAIGQLLYSTEISAKSYQLCKAELPSLNWPPAAYLVKVQGQNKKESKTFRFIKE